MKRRISRRALLLVGLAFVISAAAAATVMAAVTSTTFKMVRSSTAVTANCLANASATVTINSLGPVEVMKVNATHMPKNKEFDLFVTQLPNAPFGVSWYQGDLKTDSNGNGSRTYVGRFSIETFAVAPGVGPAPVVHNTPPFPDASSNPKFAPIHTFHLGLWFNSPADAAAAGCPNTETPFNGDHTAGVQALSTRNFPNLQGPLNRIRP